MIPDDALVPVVILALLEESVMHSPVVILHDPEYNRVLPIWIGEAEARSIAMAYQGIEPNRPLTHNLFASTLRAMDVDLFQVVIEKMENNTYFAQLYLHTPEGEEILMDARPSDSITLALDMEAPIYVAESVLDRAGQDNPFPAEIQTHISKFEDEDEPFPKKQRKPRTKLNKEPDGKPLEKPKKKSQKSPSKKVPKKNFIPPSRAKEEFSADELIQLRQLLDTARDREFDEGKET